MKEMSISPHRCRQNGFCEPFDTEPTSFCSSRGDFREAPGASWVLLGPVGVTWEAPGRPFGVSWDLSRSFLGPSGGCPGISFALHVAPVAQMGSNPIHPGRECTECPKEDLGRSQETPKGGPGASQETPAGPRRPQKAPGGSRSFPESTQRRTERFGFRVE